MNHKGNIMDAEHVFFSNSMFVAVCATLLCGILAFLFLSTPAKPALSSLETPTEPTPSAHLRRSNASIFLSLIFDECEIIVIHNGDPHQSAIFDQMKCFLDALQVQYFAKNLSEVANSDQVEKALKGEYLPNRPNDALNRLSFPIIFYKRIFLMDTIEWMFLRQQGRLAKKLAQALELNLEGNGDDRMKRVQIGQSLDLNPFVVSVIPVQENDQRDVNVDNTSRCRMFTKKQFLEWNQCVSSEYPLSNASLVKRSNVRMHPRFAVLHECTLEGDIDPSGCTHPWERVDVFIATPPRVNNESDVERCVILPPKDQVLICHQVGAEVFGTIDYGNLVQAQQEEEDENNDTFSHTITQLSSMQTHARLDGWFITGYEEYIWGGYSDEDQRKKMFESFVSRVGEHTLVLTSLRYSNVELVETLEWVLKEADGIVISRSSPVVQNEPLYDFALVVAIAKKKRYNVFFEVSLAQYTQDPDHTLTKTLRTMRNSGVSGAVQGTCFEKEIVYRALVDVFDARPITGHAFNGPHTYTLNVPSSHMSAFNVRDEIVVHGMRARKGLSNVRAFIDTNETFDQHGTVAIKGVLEQRGVVHLPVANPRISFAVGKTVDISYTFRCDDGTKNDVFLYVNVQPRTPSQQQQQQKQLVFSRERGTNNALGVKHRSSSKQPHNHQFPLSAMKSTRSRMIFSPVEVTELNVQGEQEQEEFIDDNVSNVSLNKWIRRVYRLGGHIVDGGTIVEVGVSCVSVDNPHSRDTGTPPRTMTPPQTAQLGTYSCHIGDILIAGYREHQLERQRRPYPPPISDVRVLNAVRCSLDQSKVQLKLSWRFRADTSGGEHVAYSNLYLMCDDPCTGMCQFTFQQRVVGCEVLFDVVLSDCGRVNIVVQPCTWCGVRRALEDIVPLRLQLT